MTISTEILLRSPVLYWKLDDATGPAASDSSTGGHPGTYGGAYQLHQYGPEPGTFAAQFAFTGMVSRVGMVQPGTNPWSLVWYASYNAGSYGADTTIAMNGTTGQTRGWRLQLPGSTVQVLTAWNTSGTAGVAASQNVPTWIKWWHSYAIVSNGSTTLAFWQDGAVTGNAIVTGTLSTTLGTDTLALGMAQPMVLAHVAYYDKALTNTDVATICGYRYDWPFGPMINATWCTPPAAGGGSATLIETDPVVVNLNADLDDIRQAVIHDYTTGPPT